MAEEKKRRSLVQQKVQSFLKTTKTFVLIRRKTEKSTAAEEEIIPAIEELSMEDRIVLYFTNFSSIFVNIYPDDLGTFQFAPGIDEEEVFDELEAAWTL